MKTGTDFLHRMSGLYLWCLLLWRTIVVGTRWIKDEGRRNNFHTMDPCDVWWQARALRTVPCPNTSIKDLHKRGIHVSNICCPVMVLYALIYCISADGHHQEHIFWHTSRPCRHVTVFTSNVQNVCFVSFLVNVFKFPFSQQTSVKHPVFPEAVSAWAEDICWFTIILMPLDGYTQ